MEITNESLRGWIQAEAGRLDWLVKRTKITKGTLYNYCAGRKITPPNKALLDYAIEEYEKLRAQDEKESVDIDISDEDKEIIERYAKEAKAKIEDFVSFLLENKIRKNNFVAESSNHRKSAESPGAYDGE